MVNRAFFAWRRMDGFHLRVAWWDREEDASYLAALHQAVWQDRRLRVLYRVCGVSADRPVDPLGPGGQSRGWHLLCVRNGRLRVRRVPELLDAGMEIETFERPKFGLAEFWAGWGVRRAELRGACLVAVQVALHFVGALPG